MTDPQPIQQRKTDHLHLCRDGEVEFQTKRPWFEHVELIHQAVPEFGALDVDLSQEFYDRRLAAPLIIGAMTGGTEESGEINRTLAQVASEKGIGLALGSQRAMVEHPELADTYRVREVAPDILLLGNIGLPQALNMPAVDVLSLLSSVRADGLCLHLNAAMEMFQVGGDAPRKGAFEAIERLSRVTGRRLIAKETGCGFSRETAERLARAGIGALDVAGAGGVSWVRIENLRRGAVPPGQEGFEEWGIPTAASLLEVAGLGLTVIASGGLRTGLDLAKAIALGATAGSAALPVLRAYYDGGAEAVATWIDELLGGLRTAMMLTGCRTLDELRKAPVVIGGPLGEWADRRGLEGVRRG